MDTPDLTPLVKKLKQGILEGDRLQGFEGNIHKVRVASSDQKGAKVVASESYIMPLQKMKKLI